MDQLDFRVLQGDFDLPPIMCIFCLVLFYKFVKKLEKYKDACMFPEILGNQSRSECMFVFTFLFYQRFTKFLRN